jgi:hypothetical protein
MKPTTGIEQMNTTKQIALSLSIVSILSVTSISHAASLGQADANTTRTSLIEQNLYNKHKMLEEDNLMFKTKLSAAPSQTFFAAQHQRFSRFVQSLFS